MSKPFIKWAGGKTLLAKYIVSLLPKKYTIKRYLEPFLGSGAVFFKFKPKSAFLSDINIQLINCYLSIRDNPKTINNYLRKYEKLNSEEYYYYIRNKYNNSKLSIAQAARFIYLNKSCYNGVFRVNLKSKFNVPYSYKSNLALPTLEELIQASLILKNTEIKALHYLEVLNMVKSGDFVYLDPPYTIENHKNGFIKYNSILFTWEDQKLLKSNVDLLTKRNVKVLMTNSAHKSVQELYKDYNIVQITRSCCIDPKKIRKKINELIITNY